MNNRHPVLVSGRPVALNGDSPQARGLVHWWPLNGGNLNDLVAGNRASFQSTVKPGILPNYGPAIAPTGTNGDRLTLANNVSISGAYSFSAVINLTGDAVLAGNDGNQYTLYVVPGGDTYTRTDLGAFRLATANGIVSGKTHRIIITRNSSNLCTVYLDGISDGSGTRTGTYDIQSLGGYNKTSGTFAANPFFSDMRIYDRCLSADEAREMCDPRMVWDLYKVSARVFAIVSGGTTYFESHAGTLTSSGTITRQANKSFAGTLTSAGTVIKQAAKSFVGTLTSAGDLVRQTNKPFVGTLTTSGTLATVKTALVSLAGTLTTAGSLVRQTNKPFGGTLTTAGDLVRQTSKSFSGTLASTGDVVKQTAKSFGGTLTSSGVVSAVKTALVSLSGTLTTAGSLVRQTNKSFTGTLTSAGDVVKQAAKTFGGTLTTAGDVARQTAKSFVGTLTSSGVLAAAKSSFISLAGTLSLSGGVTKQTNKILSGALTTAGAITKQINKAFDGTLTMSGVLTALSDAIEYAFRTLNLRARPIILKLRKRDGRSRK